MIDQTIIDRFDYLPGFPRATRVAQTLIKRSSLTSDDLFAMVRMDPILCARVLRIANSPYEGLESSVSTLQSAISVTGPDRIAAVIDISASILSTTEIPQESTLSSLRFWRHSLIVGRIAESIARHLQRYEQAEVDEAFCAGYLHDIGKLVIAIENPDVYLRTLIDSQEQAIPFAAAEDPDASHSVIGGCFAERWHLPVSIGDSLRWHHDPSKADPSSRRTVIIVYLADVMAHVLGHSIGAIDPPPAFNEQFAQEIHLPPERLRVIAYEVLKEQKNLESEIGVSD